MNREMAREFANIVAALNCIKAAMHTLNNDDMGLKGVQTIIDWTIERAEDLQEEISERTPERAISSRVSTTRQREVES